MTARPGGPVEPQLQLHSVLALLGWRFAWLERAQIVEVQQAEAVSQPVRGVVMAVPEVNPHATFRSAALVVDVGAQPVAIPKRVGHQLEQADGPAVDGTV